MYYILSDACPHFRHIFSMFFSHISSSCDHTFTWHSLPKPLGPCLNINGYFSSHQKYFCIRQHINILVEHPWVPLLSYLHSLLHRLIMHDSPRLISVNLIVRWCICPLAPSGKHAYIMARCAGTQQLSHILCAYRIHPCLHWNILRPINENICKKDAMLKEKEIGHAKKKQYTKARNQC